MKVVVLFSSPRKNSNTKKLLDKYLKETEIDGSNVEIIYVCDLNIWDATV
jgi:multimeric flavodoxin WrbA